MGMKKPGEKSLLVAIPMQMFRVQTKKFKSGLNYFQKAVLKLKYLPNISNQRIASLLNLDEYLINKIVDELISDGLMTSSGVVTPRGAELRNDSEQFIIDDQNTQVGYVFAYNNGKEYYPYYQKEIQYASVEEVGMTFSSVDGTKFTDQIPLDILTKTSCAVTAPSENTVLNLLKNTYHQSLDGFDDVEDLSRNQLKIDFLPSNQAENVLVCTYIYLPKVENEDYYSDDWKVLAPFGNGDSYELKLFLEEEKVFNKDFARVLASTFTDVVTENNRRFDEAEAWLNSQVAERINLLFGTENFELLDTNVKKSINSVVKAYFRMERKQFVSINDEFTQPFFINLQRAIETILLQDQKDREDVFEDLDNNYGDYAIKEDRQQCLKLVFKKRILSETQNVPSVLYKYKTKSWTGKSLLDYLMKFIMSLSVEPDLDGCKVIKVFKNRIDTIVDIAQSRNLMGHGTVNNINDSSFDRDDIQNKFQFIVEMINDYIDIQK